MYFLDKSRQEKAIAIATRLDDTIKDKNVKVRFFTGLIDRSCNILQKVHLYNSSNSAKMLSLDANLSPTCYCVTSGKLCFFSHFKNRCASDTCCIIELNLTEIAKHEVLHPGSYIEPLSNVNCY